MKHFFVIVNAEKQFAGRTRKTIEAYLDAQKDVSCTVWDGPRKEHYDLPKETDCIITIGGDGTLIQAARATVGSGVPLIGINRGHMGYLTQLREEKDIAPALSRLIAGDYRTEARMMLDVCVYRAGRRIFKNIALNEVLLGRLNSLRILGFKVYVNERLLSEYAADGMIAATPTGSTAYSLSAGGPIAEPKARLIILTPLCSHAINSRSIILAPDDSIRIVPLSNNQFVACDGDTMMPLAAGDEIEIRESHDVTRLVRLENESFLDTLREKMTYV